MVNNLPSHRPEFTNNFANRVQAAQAPLNKAPEIITYDSTETSTFSVTFNLGDHITANTVVTDLNGDNELTREDLNYDRELLIFDLTETVDRNPINQDEGSLVYRNEERIQVLVANNGPGTAHYLQDNPYSEEGQHRNNLVSGEFDLSETEATGLWEHALGELTEILPALPETSPQ